MLPRHHQRSGLLLSVVAEEVEAVPGLQAVAVVPVAISKT
jgi:hypothetical protein